MGTKELLAYVRIDCKEILKAQTCPWENWVLQRKNKEAAFEFKNRKSEAFRKESLENTNS